jgi:hypothetical protein
MPLNNPSSPPPTYHELDGSLVQQSSSAGAWVDFTLTGIPGNSLVDVIIDEANMAASLVGVRTKGSVLNRTITTSAINHDLVTMRVVCDANSKIQIWDTAANNNVYYRIIGYWA